MRQRFVVVALCFASVVATRLLHASASMPDWAYAIPAPAAAGAAPASAPDTSPKQLPGSTLTFTRQQISDGFGPADWFPADHPTMPDIVAHGKRIQGAGATGGSGDVRACGLCHYPNGKGRQENAGVSGLPISYFVQTMNDFKSGLRKSSEPRKTNTNLMIAYAKAMTPEEIRQAAEYFGAMPWTSWIKVIETATVPKVVSRGGIWIPIENAEKEPIGVRIIETPENPERTEVLRDPHSGFIAYAPIGSIKKGEALARSGECAVCHGADLNGLGPVPGIAGRSPSYIARQLYDMQSGARHGEWADLMKKVVAPLTSDDLVNLSAYVASR